MADLKDPAAVKALVGAVVDQANAGLTAAATDADARRADLATARKRTGNRKRTDEIKAAIEAEDVLAADARALAKQTSNLQEEMAGDLQKLVALAFGGD
ncbi:MAG TPA: hypothetical protein VFU30_00260 [Gaiellaceae bacterium]|nr:hypothetical protein [Gaiellaceae bacterium]